MNSSGSPLIEICHGPRCSDYGGRAICRSLDEQNIESHMSLCQSLCTYSPVVKVNGKALLNASVEEVVERLQTC